MTNEAVPVEGPYEVHDFTVASGTNIPQFSLCMLSASRTASISAGANVVWAGIANTEKSILTGDVSTNLGLATTGIFKLYAGGGTSIAVGELVELSGVNTVEGDVDEAGIIAGQVVGKNLGPAVTVGTAASIEVDISRT